MNAPGIAPVLERQLLLQLGDRLKRLRKAQGLSTIDMAARAGITRNTLRAVEAGDPAPSIGTYVRVMSILGVSGELALLAGDVTLPPPADSAAARSQRAAPVVQVRILASTARHTLQDLQSLALHDEAVRLVKRDPTLIAQARNTVERWLATGDPRSASLWRDWLGILAAGTWRKVLGRTRHAQQLRQASPLVTLLPDETRRRILAQVGDLRKGIEIGATPDADTPP